MFTQSNAKKGGNFAVFRQIKHIFTQPVAKKDASFADFWRYNRICTKPIAKKKSVMYFKKSTLKKTYFGN